MANGKHASGSKHRARDSRQADLFDRLQDPVAPPAVEARTEGSRPDPTPGEVIPSDAPSAVAELGDAAERAVAFAKLSRSEHTRLAYRKGWASYAAWCDRVGLPALGRAPQVVALYLAAAADRLALASLRLHLAAIVAAHRLDGLPLDARDARIATVLGGIARAKGRAPTRQAAPVGPERLRDLVATLGEGPGGTRDRAMLLLGFGAATRRSELVALDRADVALDARGVTVRFRRSKTDQAGEGATVAIAAAADPDLCPRRALAAWLAVRAGGDGPLFVRVRKGGRVSRERLSDVHLGNLLKRLAASAGMDPRTVSGHSLRAGLATSASARGASLERIMRQTRHRSYEAARRYLRDAEIWRANVTEGAFD